MRNAYMVFFAFTMFIGGGLIPTYMVIRSLKLLNNFWVLVLPGALNVWSAIILMNFIRGIPKSLEEAAAVDGAGYFRILFQIVLPVCLPSLASLLLFAMINHWNSWFDGMFYMNNVNNYPMATYLATQIINNNRSMTNMTPEQLAVLASLSEKTVRSAQLFISIIPILVIYPFLQRYFIKGIVVGSVKE
jgi:putative aldouronate transport system permease protein